MTKVPTDLLEEKEAMMKLKAKVSSTASQKVDKDDLVKLAKHYFKMYQVSEDERSKSLSIGQAAYYGYWAVSKGHKDIDDLKSFIKYHEIDSTMPSPDDTTEKHLKELKKILS